MLLHALSKIVQPCLFALVRLGFLALNLAQLADLLVQLVGDLRDGFKVGVGRACRFLPIGRHGLQGFFVLVESQQERLKLGVVNVNIDDGLYGHD